MKLNIDQLRMREDFHKTYGGEITNNDFSGYEPVYISDVAKKIKASKYIDEKIKRLSKGETE